MSLALQIITDGAPPSRRRRYVPIVDDADYLDAVSWLARRRQRWVDLSAGQRHLAIVVAPEAGVR